MQAIVLAAGKGTRLRPITNSTPKPLVKIAGKELIEYMLDPLPSSVSEILIVIGYQGEKLQKHVGDAYKGTPVTYIWQKELLGLAHAMMQCKDHIHDDFLLRGADDIIDAESIVKLTEYPVAALAYKHSEPQHFGVMEYNKDMILLDIEEKPKKPKSNLVSPGVFKFTKDIFEYPMVQHRNGEYYITDMIRGQYIKDHPMRVVEAKMWLTITTPEDIMLVEKALKNRTLS